MCFSKALTTGRRASIQFRNPLRSNLLSRSAISGILRFEPDHIATVIDEIMGRYYKVVGCGNATVDTAGEVEHGAVTGAEKAALPAGVEVLRLDLCKQLRRTAEVGAQTDQDHDLGLAGTELVARILRLLADFGRLGIGKVPGIVAKVAEHCLVATHHEYWLATPRRHWTEQFTRLEPADIDADRGAGGQGLGTGVPGSDKGDGSSDRARSTYH